jgi:hypothetical protein
VEERIVENALVGAWKLVSWELRSSGGDVTYPYGEDVTGYLIYTASGHMSAALMGNARAHMRSPDLRGGTDEEKSAAFDTHLSYSGRYELHQGRVVHHPDVASFPNWVGQPQERFIKIEGDRLSISTPPLLVDGVEQRSYLIWTRA